jgi:hypothetical protein
MRTLLAIVLVGGAALLGARGSRLLSRGLRDADDDGAPLWVARALRDLVVAIGVLSLAGGILFEQFWLLVFGGIFLAEEIYETGVLILVLRADLRARGTPPAAPV